jgi:hypothetical protein
MGIKLDGSILYPSVTILSIDGSVVEFRDHLGRKSKKPCTQDSIRILFKILKSGCANIELLSVNGMIQEVVCVANCPVDFDLVA